MADPEELTTHDAPVAGHTFGGVREANLLVECPFCGYALVGLPVLHRCPECGASVDRSWRLHGQAVDEAGRLWERRWRWGLRGILILLAPALLALILYGSDRSSELIFLAAVGCALVLAVVTSRLTGFRAFVAVGREGVVVVHSKHDREVYAWDQIGEAEQIAGAEVLIPIGRKQVRLGGSFFTRSPQVDAFVAEINQHPRRAAGTQPEIAPDVP